MPIPAYFKKAYASAENRILVYNLSTKQLERYVPLPLFWDMLEAKPKVLGATQDGDNGGRVNER